MSAAEAPTDPADVVRAFWERQQARDWAGAQALLAEDAEVWYPATGERFATAADFMAMSQAYPDGWSITVRAVVADGEDVLAWVEVPFHDQMMWCAQRATVRDGRILTTVDLWTTENQDEAPEWRAPFRTSPDQLAPAGPPDLSRSVSNEETV